MVREVGVASRVLRGLGRHRRRAMAPVYGDLRQMGREAAGAPRRLVLVAAKVGDD